MPWDVCQLLDNDVIRAASSLVFIVAFNALREMLNLESVKHFFPFGAG